MYAHHLQHAMFVNQVFIFKEQVVSLVQKTVLHVHQREDVKLVKEDISLVTGNAPLV